jgi:multiple sugar transport system substrate-binding protein
MSAAALLLATQSCAPAGETQAVGLLVPASERAEWEALAAGFAATHSGVRIRLVEAPNGTDLRENLYTAALLARDASFDLVLMDVTWTPKFAAAGWLVPLDARVPRGEIAALLSEAVAAGRYQGKLFRLPVRTDVGLLYYRRDLLAAAGIAPPRTLADLVRAARVLQRPPHRWGFVWQGAQYEGLVCVFLEVLRGHGGFWIDPGTLEVGLDRAEARAALDFLRACRSEAGISPPGVTTYKEEESRRLFQDGRAVFLRNWPYVWRLAQAEGSPLRGKIDVQAMPQSLGGVAAGTLGGWGLGLSRFSRNAEAALSFARYAVSLPGQRALCGRSGYAPARREAYDDPELREANPFLGRLLEVHAAAVARPPVPRYALVSDILQRRLSAAVAGLETPQAALAAAARETRLALGSVEP